MTNGMKMLAVLGLAASLVTSAAPRRSVAHGRATRTDGQGNATTVRGTRVHTANGTTATRGARNTVNADGSATHKSRINATRANGATLSSQGQSTRDAQGNVTANRSTSATSANGATYQGSTSYDSTNGKTHTATCKDAGGNVVPCPKRK